jgi:NAD(P)-dependent dehydrogenase (short-subunit alcohol dehydrogenase family)
MDDEFAGRIAWVTGAGGALGAAIARTLAAAGATVGLSGRNRDTLDAVAADLRRDAAGRALVLPMDMASRAEVDRTAAALLAKHGRIDFLVNCTALPIFGAFLELDDEAWESVLQAKFLGYVRTMRAALPSMVEHRFGRIVNVSGRGGRQPTPAHLPGCAANAAVNLLTKGIADIHGKDNIRVNAVAPGPIETPRLATIASSNDALAKQGQTGGRPANAPTPLGRLGTPQDVANAVAYLVSERSAFVTGTIHAVDGGGTAAV